MEPCSPGLPHPCFPELSANGCGIASVLSTLCFLDADVNIGKGYDVSDEERFLPNTWENKAFHRRENHDKFELAKTSAKIFYLQNSAWPPAGANAYFRAALTASYSKIIITDESGSKMASYDTAKWQEEYMKKAVDLTRINCFLREHGDHWFFCKLASTVYS